ncbi:WD40 repeat domain-containing protein, partial [Actinomadura adrarensis]
AMLTFLPDGRSLILASGFGRVEFPTGRVLARPPSGFVVDAVSDDGRTLFTYPSASNWPGIRFWDARTLHPDGQGLRTGNLSYTSAARPAASPDGNRFVSVHDAGKDRYQIRLWDRRARKQLGVPFTGLTEPVGLVTFTPDGSAVFAVDSRGRTYTYPVARDRLIRDLCEQSGGGLTEAQWKQHIPDVPYRETCPG